MKRKLSMLLATVLALAMMIGMSMTASAYSSDIDFSNPPPTRDSGIVTITDSTGCMFRIENADSHAFTMQMYVDEDMIRDWTVPAGELPSTHGIGHENLSEFNSDAETLRTYGITNIKPVLRLVWKYSPDSPTYTIELHFYTEQYYNSHYGNNNNGGAHEHNFEWRTLEEPTKLRDGVEGEVCTICGEYGHIEGITAQRYIFGAYVDSLLNSAKPGQTVTFDFGEWNSLPKSVMQKLANKSGVNYVIKFKKNHKPVTVTIPAGTPIDLQFDWYGPDKMIQLYGLSQ